MSALNVVLGDPWRAGIAKGRKMLCVEADLDMVTASLRADAADVDMLFDVLAQRLSAVLPGRVEVRRGGLLGRSRPRAITITLDEQHYEAERGRHGVACRRRTVVRGIAVKSEELTLDTWIDALSAELVAEAHRSEQAREALGALLEP